MSQSRLARDCDLSRGSIANIELARQQVPLHTLLRIVQALDVQLGSLLSTGPEMPIDDPEHSGKRTHDDPRVHAFISEAKKELKANADEEAETSKQSGPKESGNRAHSRRAKE